jgi:RNA recognition motif-containing protein
MFRLDLCTSCQAPLIMFSCGLFCRFAYIVFDLKDSLSKALELNGSDYNGRVLRVDLAGEGGGGGGEGGGGGGGVPGEGEGGGEDVDDDLVG